MVNGRHPIQKWKFFSFDSFFASAIFNLAIPSCLLALKSLQLLNIACGERTEKDVWGPLPQSLRVRSDARSSAGGPLPLLSKVYSGVTKCLRHERGRSLALWSGFSPDPYLAPSVSLSPTRSFTFSAIGIGGQRRPETGEAGGRGGKWRGCRQSLAAE